MLLSLCLALRSPDLNPYDCWFWGYLNSQVYRHWPISIGMLKENIRSQFLTIPTDMVYGAVHSIVSWLKLLLTLDMLTICSEKHRLCFFIIFFLFTSFLISWRAIYRPFFYFFCGYNETLCHSKHVCQFLILHLRYSANYSFLKWILISDYPVHIYLYVYL